MTREKITGYGEGKREGFFEVPASGTSFSKKEMPKNGKNGEEVDMREWRRRTREQGYEMKKEKRREGVLDFCVGFWWWCLGFVQNTWAVGLEAKIWITVLSKYVKTKTLKKENFKNFGFSLQDPIWRGTSMKTSQKSTGLRNWVITDNS